MPDAIPESKIEEALQQLPEEFRNHARNEFSDLNLSLSGMNPMEMLTVVRSKLSTALSEIDKAINLDKRGAS